MNKDVSVRVTGVHGVGADQDKIVSDYAGMYFEKNDKIYIRYEEKDDSSGAVRKSMIVVGGKTVTVEHKGHTNTSMLYEIGNTTRSMYITPLGSMLLEIYTSRLEIEKTDHNLRILIDYELGFDDGEKAPSRSIIEVAD